MYFHTKLRTHFFGVIVVKDELKKIFHFFYKQYFPLNLYQVSSISMIQFAQFSIYKMEKLGMFGKN